MQPQRTTPKRLGRPQGIRVPKTCPICGSVELVPPYILRKTRSCSRSCAMRARALPEEDRYWRFVDRRGPDDCWPWLAFCDWDGYGKFTNAKRQSVGAHRFGYALAHGPIPEGIKVLHRCDNPPCVNPVHLFLGTTADNNRDKGEKGRAPRGEAHKRSVLTTAIVQEARFRYQNGDRTTHMAKEYGVLAVTLQAAIARRTWRHVE